MKKKTSYTLLRKKMSSKEHPVRNRQPCCSAAEWLQKALQKSCEVGCCSSAKFRQLKQCHGQRFASDKKRFSSDTKTPKKDNQRCWIAAIRFKNAKYVYEVFISEAIGSGLAAFDSKLIVPGPCSHARNHNCKKMQIFLIIYSFSLPVFIECPSSLFYLVVCPNGEYCEKPVHELSLQWFI